MESKAKVVAVEENVAFFRKIQKQWERGFLAVQEIEDILWDYFREDRPGVDCDVMGDLPDVIDLLWNDIVRCKF